MVRDHRGDELSVADQRLDARGAECRDEQNEETGNEKNVRCPVRIHAAHCGQHENPHRRHHGERHVEHIDIVPEITPSVDHREHDEVHDGRAEEHIDGEGGIGMPVRPMTCLVMSILH